MKISYNVTHKSKLRKIIGLILQYPLTVHVVKNVLIFAQFYSTTLPLLTLLSFMQLTYFALTEEGQVKRATGSLSFLIKSNQLCFVYDPINNLVGLYFSKGYPFRIHNGLKKG